ncbi:MAG: hypothetical protein JSV79_12410 [Armatimonadota bacterium]|nr:MAG: hypothetical protein JSV79_12410 [Armatimonadota bacterium]
MPPRKQMSLIELMIIMAIVGILAAILIPGLKQAKQRTETAPTPGARQQVEPDGQLNTIEVSEVSPTADHDVAEEWKRVVGPLVPLAFTAVVVAAILISVRRQMSRNAKQ